MGAWQTRSLCCSIYVKSERSIEFPLLTLWPRAPTLREDSSMVWSHNVNQWELRCFFTPFGRPVHLGPVPELVWLGRRTYPRALFTPNRSVGRAIPDNFGANQWGQTGVSGNDNHSLLITLKESQFAIQFFHYRLPLCQGNFVLLVEWILSRNQTNFPFQWSYSMRPKNEWTLLGTPWKTIWLVDESDVVLILSLGDGHLREHPRRTLRHFFTLFLGVRRLSRAFSPRRTGRPMEWKRSFSVLGLGCLANKTSPLDMC